MHGAYRYLGFGQNSRYLPHLEELSSLSSHPLYWLRWCAPKKGIESFWMQGRWSWELGVEIFSLVVSMFASWQQLSIQFLTIEFHLHILNCIGAKISVWFYGYSQHPKPPVLGSSNVCQLHYKPTRWFLVFTEMGMKVFLIELPYLLHPLTMWIWFSSETVVMLMSI